MMTKMSMYGRSRRERCIYQKKWIATQLLFDHSRCWSLPSKETSQRPEKLERAGLEGANAAVNSLRSFVAEVPVVKRSAEQRWTARKQFQSWFMQHQKQSY